MTMLSPEEYAKKQKEMLAAIGKDKDNGLSQSAPNVTPTTPSSISQDENTRIRLPEHDARGNDSTAGTVESDAVSARPDNTDTAKDSVTETSNGLQHEGDNEDVLSSNVTAIEVVDVSEKLSNESQEELDKEYTSIDPADAYCDECGKDIADCDCLPTDDTEGQSEAEILASLGISAEQANKFKPEPIHSDNGKDIENLTTNTDIESNLLSAAEIVAREYATTEDDLIVFRNIFNETHEKVKDLFPDQLEQKIMHLERVIKAIQAMQQACARLKSDKIEKETSKEKAERKEREKKYKIPRRRGSDEVDKEGALKTKEVGKLSKRDKLIADLIKAGLSKDKAEALADGQ